MIHSVKGSTSGIQGYEPMGKGSTPKADMITEKNNEAVVLELNQSQESRATYSRPIANKVDIDEVNRLLKESEELYRGLRELVLSLISKQGLSVEDVRAGKEILIVDEEVRAKAEEAISEEGEWGVKAVSDRLVAFAKAISGNDKTKLDEIKDAIAWGFEEAEKLFGGKLPEICSKTYDETMRKLDEWANSNEG